MKLVLLRHADATPSAATDAARPLTEKGRGQARRVGRFCLEASIVPELILTSPYTRAAQTAKIVAAELEAELQEAPFLASGMGPAAALAELRGYVELSTLLLVGHEPDLSLLSATLLGLPSAEALRVRKATLVGFEIGTLRPGAAQLDFLVPVSIL